MLRASAGPETMPPTQDETTITITDKTMKKMLIFAGLLAAACGWSCSESDDAAPKLRVLTFEDTDYAGAAPVTGY